MTLKFHVLLSFGTERLIRCYVLWMMHQKSEKIVPEPRPELFVSTSSDLAGGITWFTVGLWRTEFIKGSWYIKLKFKFKVIIWRVMHNILQVNANRHMLIKLVPKFCMKLVQSVIIHHLHQGYTPRSTWPSKRQKYRERKTKHFYLSKDWHNITLIILFQFEVGSPLCVDDVSTLFQWIFENFVLTTLGICFTCKQKFGSYWKLMMLSEKKNNFDVVMVAQFYCSFHIF